MEEYRTISRLSERPSQGLADVLERILDKGVVIAGDIRISLVNVELLTIKIRLLIASVDKAAEVGIDWWTRDGDLSDGTGKQGRKKIEDKPMQKRLAQLEDKLESILERLPAKSGTSSRASKARTTASSHHQRRRRKNG
jgi:hypothetical protein